MNDSKPIADRREFLPIARQAALGILPEVLTISEIAAMHPDGDSFARLLLEECAVYWHREFTRDKDPELYPPIDPKKGDGLRGELASGPVMFDIMMSAEDYWETDPLADDVRNGLFVSIHRDDLKAWLQTVGYWPLPADALLNAWWKLDEQECATEPLPRSADTATRNAKPEGRKEKHAAIPRDRDPRTLEIVVDVRGEQVTVRNEKGASETYSRAEITGKGKTTWRLLILFAAREGAVEKGGPEVNELNYSKNRSNLGKTLMEALGLLESPFIEGSASGTKFKSIRAENTGIDAMDRKRVSFSEEAVASAFTAEDDEEQDLDGQATALLARHGVDMPPIKSR